MRGSTAIALTVQGFEPIAGEVLPREQGGGWWLESGGHYGIIIKSLLKASNLALRNVTLALRFAALLLLSSCASSKACLSQHQQP
jgi:hypothetical protein